MRGAIIDQTALRKNHPLMSLRGIALTCLADARLRGVCGILLRHAGFQVIEVTTVADAIAIADQQLVTLLVVGALVDPDEQLMRFCEKRSIRSVRLAAAVPIEALLVMFSEFGV
jgi:hypothetical protein